MRKKRRITVKVKLKGILILFILGLMGLTGRVWYLKTARGEEYETRAKTQQISKYDAVIPANRGSIVDRNNQVLAVSTAIYNIILDSRNLSQATEKEQEKVLQTLVKTFPNDIDYDKIKGFITINPQTKKPYLDNSWKYLVKGVDREIKEGLEKEGLKGIVYEKDTRRSYPVRYLACHVLGFIRGDTSWGIENWYNQYMSGTTGRSFISYDGNSTALQKVYGAKDGDTVVTTIDYTIQQYAVQAVQEAAAQWKAENVAALVMNPNTGEIYAMADSNIFDLNKPSEPIALSDGAFKKQWEAMGNKAQMEYLNKVWKNFSVTSTFEPGSIFKPLVVAAALEENIITTNSTFYCSGVKTVYDREIRCHLRSGHGQESVEDILANSCNIGMMDIAFKMGKDLFYKYQKEFGFGEKTGIDLPGEVSASNLLFSPDKIGPTELATMSFGQSFNCTAIQMINAFSATINGGNLMKPHVVSQVLDEDGKVVLENKPEIIRKVISNQTSDLVRNYLKATVERGTGKKAKIEGYSIGGKTGTAQQGSRSTNREWVLSYIAYFPVENPEFVVMTIINRPDGYADGIQSPSPMTKKLMENIIKYKNIEPSRSAEKTVKKDKSEKITIDNFSEENLYDILTVLDGKGLNYKVVGTGNTITNQVPHAGAQVEEGSEIILYVKKQEGDGETIAVPNVMGKTYNKAVTALNDAGFEVSVEGDKDGVVVKQSPKHGISANKGQKIIISLENKEEKKEVE